MPSPLPSIGMALGARLTASLGAGMVALVLSEYVFLNEGPVAAFRAALATPVALAAGLAELALYYAAFAYVARVAMWGFRARGWAGLALGGALLGWLIEGVVIPLVYEAPPLSFVWPSLGWHLAVTFGVGWVALPALLRWRSRGRRVAVLASAGVAWAVWAHLFHAEDPAMILPTAREFAALAGVSGAILIAGLWAMERPWALFRPGRVDVAVALLLSVPLAVLMAWSAGLVSLGLLAMVGTTLWAMGRLGRGGAATDAAAAPVAPSAYADLLAFPATAAVVFPLLPAMPSGLSFLVVLPLTVVATAVWAAAILKSLRQGRAAR